METRDAAVAPTSRSLTVDVDSFVTPRMTANSPAADRRGSTSSDSSNGEQHALGPHASGSHLVSHSDLFNVCARSDDSDSASSSSTEAINAVVSPAEVRTDSHSITIVTNTDSFATVTQL